MEPANKCLEHNKPFEVICNHCIKLLCNRCSPKHLQEVKNRDHICTHIDDIRESLSLVDLNNLSFNVDSSSQDSNNSSDSSDQDNNSNNNNSESNHSDTVNSNTGYLYKLNLVWTMLKDSSDYLGTLQMNEKEISNHFRQLHDYLIVAEHKLKKQIISEIDSTKDQIKHHVESLKSLINIINFNNNPTTEPEPNSTGLSTYEIGSATGETTQQFSMESILLLVRESETLQQFYNSNSNTIFDHQHNINNNNVYINYKNIFNNNIDTIILQAIYDQGLKNKQFLECNDYTKNKIYFSIIKSGRFIQYLKEIIPQTIKVHTQYHPYPDEQRFYFGEKDIDNNGIIINDQHKYIFSLHSKGSTLIDITDNNNITYQEIDFTYYYHHTHNSVVNVDDLIYIFGGYGNGPLSTNVYCIFSLKSKSIEHYGRFDENDGGSSISVCYDGSELIYLIGGEKDLPRDLTQVTDYKRIDTFNIRTRELRKHYSYSYKNTYKSDFPFRFIISFFYNDLLYSIQDRTVHIVNAKYIKNKKNHTIYEVENLFINPKAACTDGNGNVYIFSFDNNLIRFNVDTKIVEHLTPTRITGFYSAIYSNSFIYLFGGRLNGDQYYSVEQNQWFKCQGGDQYYSIEQNQWFKHYRHNHGSCLVEFK